MCFFLPEVLYLVRYEMGLCSCFELKNAYLHVGEKHYLIKMKWFSAKECCLLKRNTLFAECLFVKPALVN